MWFEKVLELRSIQVEILIQFKNKSAMFNSVTIYN